MRAMLGIDERGEFRLFFVAFDDETVTVLRPPEADLLNAIRGWFLAPPPDQCVMVVRAISVGEGLHRLAGVAADDVDVVVAKAPLLVGRIGIEDVAPGERLDVVE